MHGARADGVSGNVDLGTKLYLTGWALIGGFGAGSDSMWDVMGALGYKFSNRFSAIAGYRVLGVDYEKGVSLMTSNNRESCWAAFSRSEGQLPVESTILNKQLDIGENCLRQQL